MTRAHCRALDPTYLTSLPDTLSGRACHSRKGDFASCGSAWLAQASGASKYDVGLGELEVVPFQVRDGPGVPYLNIQGTLLDEGTSHPYIVCGEAIGMLMTVLRDRNMDWPLGTVRRQHSGFAV